MTNEFEPIIPLTMPQGVDADNSQRNYTEQDIENIRGTSAVGGAIGGALVALGLVGAINESIDYLTQRDIFSPGRLIADLVIGTAFIASGIETFRRSL